MYLFLQVVLGKTISPQQRLEGPWADVSNLPYGDGCLKQDHRTEVDSFRATVDVIRQNVEAGAQSTAGAADVENSRLLGGGSDRQLSM